jgi:hypothetical protein
MVVAEPANADAVVAALTRAGETAMRLGTVVLAKAGAPRVGYSGQLDLSWRPDV